jgi:hypothetical protein
VGALSLGSTIAVGAAIAWNPWVGAGAMAAILVCTLGASFARRLPNLFLGSLGAILMGYAFFGRSFAYIGVAPVFVGELVLLLGLLAALMSGGLASSLRSPLSWLFVAFAGWCATRTLPYFRIYGMDALRDAVIWGYGIFALLVVAFLPRSGWLTRIPTWYGRMVPWFVAWVPIGWVIFHFFGAALPTMPGSESVSVLNYKPGDMAVHLAGVAAFLVLSLHQFGEAPARGGRRALEWIVWAIWLVGFMIVAVMNRGGALASIAALFTVMLLRPAVAGQKMPIIAGLAVFLILGFSVVNTSWEISERNRDLSPDQIITNLKSIGGGSGNDALDGSRQWRLAWWDRIMDYTIHGERFWTGKGFGINLADADGFQVTDDRSLRSPHNAHLMLLARAGVPGAVLWLLLQGAFAVGMLRAYMRARRAGLEWWARMAVWVLAYWLAFLVNGSFDVFLEGPPGGIWFWSIVGLGIVIIAMPFELVLEARIESPRRSRGAVVHAAYDHA